MKSARPSAVSPNTAVLVLAGAGFASLYLLFSVAPVLAARSAGGVGAGLATAVFMTTTVLIQLLLPRITARVPPHALVAASLLFLAVPAPAYSWSGDLWAVLLVTAVRGVGFGIISVVGVALVSEYSQERRGKALGIYGLATSVTGVVAPPLGLVMLQAGHGTLAFIGALVIPMAAMALIRIVQRTSPRPLSPAGGEGRRLSAAWRDGALMRPALLFLPCAVAYGGIYSFLPLSSEDAAAALLAFGVAFAAARLLGGPMADRVRSDVLAVVLLGWSLIGVLMTAWTSGWALLAAAFLAGAGIGGLATVSLVAVMAGARAGEGALASSIWNLTFDLGIAMGGLGLGLLAPHTNYAILYVAAATGIAVALFAAVLHMFRPTPGLAT